MIDKHNSQDTNFNTTMNYKRAGFGKPHTNLMHGTIAHKKCKFKINLSQLLNYTKTI